MRIAFALSFALAGCAAMDGSGDGSPADDLAPSDGGARDLAQRDFAGADLARRGDASQPGDAAAPDGGSDDQPFAIQRAACAFSAGALPKDTFGPSVTGQPIPIDTFVLVVQENRSFDHYFSQLPKAGQMDADVAADNATNPDANGKPVARFHQTNFCAPDTAHGWNAMHADWDAGKMDGYVTTNDPGGSRALGYFDAGDLPFYYGLATTFAIGDRYFAPTMTQTGPNRLFLYAATSGGTITNNGAPPSIKTTIFDELNTAGVSWKVYRPANYSFEESIFPSLIKNQPQNFKAITDYDTDVAAGTLPHVVFVYVGADEHPPADMQKGETAVYHLWATLAAAPKQWAKTAFVVTYDEGGGLYDHVPPPKACKPDNIAPVLAQGDTPGDFAQYGFRVPITVASPWSKPHYVSHLLNDHTSITRLIELRFALPAMTARDANANGLLDLFDFSKVSFPNPPQLPAASVDPNHAC